ncbi:putative NADPH-dependent methylglyoxal reductase GRP2 [Chaetomidium leptoderma]|uniref:NADPH-dependent methylglyoxal reductase GRP2 n=1 Tax=Chaetomidium leptoderma TaxID=669021 RepID=A0AAN6VKI5_9PEZI|nr:putative NADPH-dependent methylglyoxal reductase GRP2 [Chaetomidium leptoderma]
MISSQDLVCITGATGFVGSSTLLHLLRAGYRVRAAVRSEAKIESVLARPQIQALNPGSRLTFAIVPDITVPGAYDDAVEEATHVIHIASPLASGGNAVPLSEHERRFIYPAVRGTLNMLEAADRAGSVRRVVITSSFVALVPLEELEGTRIRDARYPVTANDRIPFSPGPYKSEFAAYAASKVAALQQTEDWLALQRPAFDVVHLHPGFVLGRNEMATTPAQAMQGTNSVVLALLLGGRFGPYAGATVHVEDVARAHVAALAPRVFGGESYILSAPARWDDAIGVAKRAFRDAFKKKILVNSGSVETTPLPMDTTITEMAFRFEFASYETQVESVVEQFLELRSRKKGSKPTADTAMKQEVNMNVRAIA